ncbi:GNAT family protein [Parvularcula sp. LCG005]|uniref:GNAT family N-acetyltransferase n=1 Tax=Parvularcula sp. LCG005 TaxID=3078805 RepID=UPI002942BD05|nr:GNAT family protein [Parvularcula sp. LCG005]WOI54221.1 GNAT family protein [Parvularcula sp. LCG005]
MRFAGPWSLPSLSKAEGRFVRLEPYDRDKHADALFDAVGRIDSLWHYMPSGPFGSTTEMADLLDAKQGQSLTHWITHVIFPLGGQTPIGMSSYMRLRPEVGSAEIGAIVFSPTAQRTAASSEAIMLMIRHLFEVDRYRRLEWKCDRTNSASRQAALRFGFQFEGTFRQDMVLKGRNRDTDWFSIIDSDWPALGEGYRRWLDEIDDGGQQQAPLSSYLAR